MDELISIADLSSAEYLQLLEKTQWMDGDQIQHYHHQQLNNLVEHHRSHNPFYSNFLKKTNKKVDPAKLRSLPILKRRDIQNVGDHFFTNQIPKHHEPISHVETSGSTGEPVKVKKTLVSSKFWAAYTIRDHLWNMRDFRGRLSSIRPYINDYVEMDSWGRPVRDFFRTGSGQGIPITLNINKQYELVSRFSPEVMIIYPNNLRALIEHMAQQNYSLRSVKHIKTVGETVSEDLRALAQSAFGLKIEDSYTSQELGTIAIQCPISNLYHIMSENIILEVLDQDNNQCQEGEIGRVVLTDLHNYASPLIRYDIGDYAQVGGKCSCGRGSPTLMRILGRERNLILKPDGSKHWPVFGYHRFVRLVPMYQYQFIQHSINKLEMKVYPVKPLSFTDKKNIQDIVFDAIGATYDFEINEYVNYIPKKNGKFEEFINMCK